MMSRSMGRDAQCDSRVRPCTASMDCSADSSSSGRCVVDTSTTALRKSGVPSAMPHAAVRYNGDTPVTCVPSSPSMAAIADRIDAATSP